MSSPSVAAYFNVRKRAATEEAVNIRNKVLRLESTEGESNPSIDRAILVKNRIVDQELDAKTFATERIVANAATARITRDAPTEKRVTRRVTKRVTESAKDASNQPKIVKFTLGGTLSPKKKLQDAKAFQAKGTNNLETGTTTPQKQAVVSQAEPSTSSATKTAATGRTLSGVKKNLSFEDIKQKVQRSSRLEELKSLLSKHQKLDEQYQACISKRNAKAKQQAAATSSLGGQSLKPFETIELEVLSSPQKGLKTPTKSIAPDTKTPTQQNELMSPKRDITPRRLFSPTKSSPTPAYQRFQTLIEAGVPTLQLPFKYRCLGEMFRCVDSVCSIFYNRKETITFKKLKPAVQRMLRKNFSETNLAQIKFLYPDAYSFEQKKMLNPGSHTKYDYYQLVIVPNVQPVPEGVAKLDEDNIVKNADSKTMNPQIMTNRLQKFNSLLVDRVKREHDKFLKSLTPAINIPMEKIRRWHQEFDLESCSEILPGELPQPPNIEKFSSAKDILSTARNLFNCATPMERIMDRYETAQRENQTDAVATPAPTPEPIKEDPIAKVLKGVPKSLLEKIRAKQAAKALDAMTRRPSQDMEANKYSRLPELARYIRNIFVTENKGVLELEKVMAKLENSFREKMTRDGLKELLELMAKEAPRNWLTFHFIRKTDFVKINRNENLTEVIKELERKAQEKAE